MTIEYSHIDMYNKCINNKGTQMEQISKTEFKAHALEVFRDIEKTGVSRIITDRGRPTLEIRKLRTQKRDPLDVLKGTVVKYDRPTEPVGEDDWENA